MAKERIKYRGNLQSGAMVNVQFPQFKVMAAGMDDLSRKLDIVNDFALKKLDKQMLDEGTKYAAENPVSVDQFLNANPAEKNKLIQGNKNTTYGQAIRVNQLNLLTSQITMKAQKDFSDLKTQAYVSNMDLETYTAQLNAIVEGYTESLLDVDGEASIVANAKLASTANTYLTSYSDKLLKDHRNMQDAIVLGYSNDTLDLIPDIIKGGAEQGFLDSEGNALLDQDGKEIKLTLDELLKRKKEIIEAELVANNISPEKLLQWSKDWDARVIREKDYLAALLLVVLVLQLVTLH